MWVLFAVLGAVSKALTAVFRKKISTSDSGIYVLLSSAVITVMLLGVAALVPGERLSSVVNAPVALILAGLVQMLAVRANMYAFKHEELSYITPMFALTPIYAALIAYVTLGEKPSMVGVLGIVALVVGVYIVTGSREVRLKDTANHTSCIIRAHEQVWLYL